MFRLVFKLLDQPFFYVIHYWNLKHYLKYFLSKDTCRVNSKVDIVYSSFMIEYQIELINLILIKFIINKIFYFDIIH